MDPSETETSGQSRAGNVSAAACDVSKLNRPSIPFEAITGCFRTMFSIRTSPESRKEIDGNRGLLRGHDVRRPVAKVHVLKCHEQSREETNRQAAR